MKAVLLILVTIFLCALCVEADVAVQPDFDIEKFAGLWNIMAVASDCAILQQMKSSITTSVAIFKVVPPGDLAFTVGYPTPEECKKMELSFKATDQPGHFIINIGKFKKDMRVMETDYTGFSIVYALLETEGEPSCTTIQLYTRAPDMSAEATEKFKTQFHSMGFTDDQLTVLPKSDKCLKALSG